MTKPKKRETLYIPLTLPEPRPKVIFVEPKQPARWRGVLAWIGLGVMLPPLVLAVYVLLFWDWG